MTRFDLGFTLTVGNEGGFVADPNDHGCWTGGKVGRGECKGTNFGISAAAYPLVDIRNLTVDGAKSIYRTAYWTKARCDAMPAPLDVGMFDAAVHHGVAGATRLLQQALGVAPDGIFGQITAAALHKALVPGPDHAQRLALDLCARRLVLMAGLPAWRNYGLGWSRRVVHMAALAGFTAPDAPLVPPPAPRIANA